MVRIFDFQSKDVSSILARSIFSIMELIIMQKDKPITIIINKIELNLLIKAINEFEKNHYETENNKWQKIINNLSLKLNKSKK